MARYDRVLVPGDGTSVRHRALAPDLGRGSGPVAEDTGTTYTVTDRDCRRWPNWSRPSVRSWRPTSRS
ncbi:hypothetical protein BRD17_06510 [Halobacteriales archaeon SW_7_68_16]|nr:MAG: hypothetical protein BRD17_06510 [Halobacteriales archaeon SW_7_68_16]